MSGPTRRAPAGLVGLLGLAMAALAVACSSGPAARGSDPPPHGGASPGASAVSRGSDAVTLHLVAFDPPTLEVARGATVTWTQTDEGAVHTVTSGTVDADPTGATTTHPDGRFDSGQLAEGARFSFTFSQPGAYPYFCIIHQATMRGEVRVR